MTGQVTGQREWFVGACSGQAVRRLAACYMHRRATLHDPLSDLSARRLLVRP